jgi:hypothetical protein
MKEVVADQAREPVERGGALVGLCGASEEPAVADRMREFYEIPELRAKALEAMWRSFDRQFSDYFPIHLDDEDAEIKRQAIWGVGFLGLASEAGKLSGLFDNDEFREDALFAYALCSPGEFSRGRVRGILRKIDNLAGGLSPKEAAIVQSGLDQRLMMHGFEAVFEKSDEVDETDEPRQGPQLVKSATTESEPGRNDPCPCGSGKKYKKCHGA